MTSAMQTYTTDGLSPRQRVEYWNDCIGNHITSIETRPVDVMSFGARLLAGSCGTVAIADATSTPACNRHAKSLLKQSTERAFLLHLQRCGESISAQDGREALLRNGDFTLCDSAREFYVDFRETHRILVVRIPEQELTRRLPHVEDLTCIRMPSEAGINGVVSGLIIRYWQLCRDELDPLLRQRISANTLDLLATAYSSMQRAAIAESSLIASRRLLIKEFIEQNLGMAELSPAIIARRFGYTKSYIHQLFRAEEESICHYIIRRRLEEAAKTLASDVFSSRTVGEIACDWGFNSLTHFGRAFKDHFSVSPREYRQGCREPAPRR